MTFHSTVESGAEAFPGTALRSPGAPGVLSSGGKTAADRPYAWQSPSLDARLEEALRLIGAEIAALRVPGLAGVVLGGGYGRGEGGVRVESASGREDFSNDLDFYSVTREGLGDADSGRIARALAPLGEKWSRELGVEADFCAVRTPWRLRHDQERLMVQELLRGHRDVAGAPGRELFRGVALRDASELPWSEAVRLLANRGAGLLLAREPGHDPDFVARNIAKAVLGAGDARLIARRAYRWAAADRAAVLSSPLYDAALAWKFRPVPAPPCDWETARATWLEAAEEVRSAQRPRRAFRHAARWVARRKSFGEWRTFGLDPIVRLFASLERTVRARGQFTASLERDWRVFN